MSLMRLLCGVLLLTGFDGRVAPPAPIDVRAVKSALLVGEPLVLVVTVRTDPPPLPSSAPTILVDRGRGFDAYRSTPFASGWHEAAGAGGGMRTEYVLAYDTRLGDWLFAAPGTYRLRVEYEDPSLRPLRSSTVAIVVTAPTGDEKIVHEALRQMGPRLLDVHRAHHLGELRELVQRFPDSAYLQEARFNDLNARIARAARSSAGPGAVRERLAALVPDLEAAARVPGPFQPEVLLVLAALHHEIGNQPLARAVYERIVREFPDREAARLARRETQ
jgi:hypothetical protein